MSWILDLMLSIGQWMCNDNQSMADMDVSGNSHNDNGYYRSHLALNPSGTKN